MFCNMFWCNIHHTVSEKLQYKMVYNIYCDEVCSLDYEVSGLPFSRHIIIKIIIYRQVRKAKTIYQTYAQLHCMCSFRKMYVSRNKLLLGKRLCRNVHIPDRSLTGGAVLHWKKVTCQGIILDYNFHDIL